MLFPPLSYETLPLLPICFSDFQTLTSNIKSPPPPPPPLQSHLYLDSSAILETQTLRQDKVELSLTRHSVEGQALLSRAAAVRETFACSSPTYGTNPHHHLQIPPTRNLNSQSLHSSLFVTHTFISNCPNSYVNLSLLSNLVRHRLPALRHSFATSLSTTVQVQIS